MQFKIETARLESHFDGPDVVKMRLTSPTGAAVDLVQEIPRDGGSAWLRETLGAGQPYEYFEARKRAGQRKVAVVEEQRVT